MTYRAQGVGEGVGATVAAAAHNGEVLYLRGDPREVVGQVRQRATFSSATPCDICVFGLPPFPNNAVRRCTDA